jgi:hypothetical protein
MEWRQGGGLVWLNFPTAYSFVMISPNLHATWVFLLMNLSQDLTCFPLVYFVTLGNGYSLKGSKNKPSRHKRFYISKSFYVSEFGKSSGNFDTAESNFFRIVNWTSLSHIFRIYTYLQKFWGGAVKTYFRENHCFPKKGCRNMGVWRYMWSIWVFSVPIHYSPCVLIWRSPYTGRVKYVSTVRRDQRFLKKNFFTFSMTTTRKLGLRLSENWNTRQSIKIRFN